MVDRMPVVLLHGAMRRGVGMRPTANFLRRRGFDARAFDYATRRADLDTHAEHLEDQLRAWLGEREVPVLGFLTHSMGGVVARALLARSSFLQWIPRQRMVMLAPPNRGSALARARHGFRPFHWLYGRAADELQPERIARLPPPPPTCATLILVGGRGGERGYNPRLEGDNDGVVARSESVLPGIEPRFVGGVHSFLQWRPSVLEIAAEFLAGERSDPEGAHPARSARSKCGGSTNTPTASSRPMARMGARTTMLASHPDNLGGRAWLSARRLRGA